MEITLSEGKAMSIRYGLDDFLVFAFQRGYSFMLFEDVVICSLEKMTLKTGC